MKRAIEIRRLGLCHRSARCVFHIAFRRLGVNQPVWAPDAERHRRRAWDERRSRTACSSHRRTTTPYVFVSSGFAADDADGLPRTRRISATRRRPHRKWCDVGSRRGIRRDRRSEPAARIPPGRDPPCQDRVEPCGAAWWQSPTSPDPPHLLHTLPNARPSRVRHRNRPALWPHCWATRRPLRGISLDRCRREHGKAHQRDKRTHGQTRCCNLHRNSELLQRIGPRGLSDGVRRIHRQGRQEDRATRPSLLNSVRRVPPIRSSFRTPQTRDADTRRR